MVGAASEGETIRVREKRRGAVRERVRERKTGEREGGRERGRERERERLEGLESKGS